jgi:hypothetical protein
LVFLLQLGKEEDHDLNRDGRHEDEPEVLTEGDEILKVDRYEERPDEKGRADKESGALLPKEAGAGSNDKKCRGDGPNEDNPHDVEILLLNESVHVDGGHGEPDEASSHRRYDDLVVLIFVLGDLGDFFFARTFGDKGVNAHAIEISKLFENIDGGYRFAKFPFRDAFVTIPDLLG